MRFVIVMIALLLIIGCDGHEGKIAISKEVDGTIFLIDTKPRVYRSSELRISEAVERVGNFQYQDQCVQLVYQAKIFTPIIENAKIIDVILLKKNANPPAQWELFGAPLDSPIKTSDKRCPPPYFYLTGVAPFEKTAPLSSPLVHPAS